MQDIYGQNDITGFRWAKAEIKMMQAVPSVPCYKLPGA